MVISGTRWVFQRVFAVNVDDQQKIDHKKMGGAQNSLGERL